LQKVTEQHQVTTKEVIERTRDILKVGYTVQIAGFNYLTDLVNGPSKSHPVVKSVSYPCASIGIDKSKKNLSATRVLRLGLIKAKKNLSATRVLRSG
jgi:hypothetical protein